MKILFFATFLSISSPAIAKNDWLSTDKALHFSLSFALGAGSYSTLWAISDDSKTTKMILSNLIALGPGLLKEIYDAGQPNNNFSGHDMIWNFVGALAGSSAILGINILMDRKQSSKISFHIGVTNERIFVSGIF